MSAQKAEAPLCRSAAEIKTCRAAQECLATTSPQVKFPFLPFLAYLFNRG